MEKTKTAVSNYINSLDSESKADIAKLDKLISKAAPKVPKVMWEGKFWGGSDQKIIGYGDYNYVRPGKNDVEWFVVGLAQQKNYITVFITAVEDGKYLAEDYKDKLGKVKVGRSSISFKKLEDVNVELLVELIKKSFKIMLPNL